MVLATEQWFTPLNLAAIVAGISSIIGLLLTATVTVIGEIRKSRELFMAHADASRTRGIVLDKDVSQIHVLVNSRLVAVLRMLVVAFKKEADRTSAPDDLQAYQTALDELTTAEANAQTSRSLSVYSTGHEEEAARAADDKLIKALGKSSTVQLS